MGFILFIIAYLLFLPLSLINFILVGKKGYFKDSAISLDKYANREFRTLWNKTLKNELGYQFGNVNETISSALGKNERDKTLTKTGEILVYLLNKIERNHCFLSIIEF